LLTYIAVTIADFSYWKPATKLSKINAFIFRTRKNTRSFAEFQQTSATWPEEKNIRQTLPDPHGSGRAE